MIHRRTSRPLLIALAALEFSTVMCSAAEQYHHEVSRSRVLYAGPDSVPLQPVQRVVVTVDATAERDMKTGWWTYHYSVKNEGRSKNALDRFALRPMREPVSVVSPAHWIGYYGSDGDSTAVVWSVRDAGSPPPNWSGNDVYLGPYNPKPGHTVSGFVIVSRQRPVKIRFYAQGFDTLQAGGEEGLESPPTIFGEGVTGTTIGPDR